MINLYIVDYFNAGRANGLSAYVKELSKGITQNKSFRLHYIWVNSTGYKGFEKKVTEDAVHYYIPRHIAVPNDRSGYDIQVAGFLAGEMTYQENVIVHFNWINHSPFSNILKQQVSCKTILTKHCIPWRDFIVGRYPLFLQLNDFFKEGKNSETLHPALKREWISYDAVDHIIAVTRFGKRALTNLLHYPEDKITVIHNGLDNKPMGMQQRDKYSLRKKYGFDAEEKIILYVGNIDQKKGVFDLVEVFENVVNHFDKKIRLVLAGHGKHSELLTYIKSLWSKITLTGNISKETLYDFYAMADIGVVPSYVEQCSYTAIEMMHAGLPMIVADVDGLQEIAPDDGCLKVKLILGKEKACIDLKDLNEKLLFCLENEPVIRKHALSIQKYAEENFNARRMIDQTLKVYERIINKEVPKEKIELNLKNQPLISILLPCFNAERYLKDCLKSILEQSYPNFEIIVVDDASKDKTAQVIKEFDDVRFKYVKNNQNLGVKDSLNKAISLAQGKYVARLDADDLMHPDRLKKQVMYLESHSSVAVVGTWHYIIDAIGRTVNLKEYPIEDASIRLLMISIQFIISFQFAKISFQRLNEIHQLKDEHEEVGANPINLPQNKSLIINNVSFQYVRNAPPVLKNIRLIIPEKKVTAIVGDSGSGKSTLLKLILRLYKPSYGEILMGNMNVNNISLKQWRDTCGAVMQDGKIFNDTILNNIVLDDEKIDYEKLERALETAHIAAEIERLPLGYQTMMGEQGRGLSGGQKQRILIARALYKNPDYLFFDEATNSLDTLNEQKIVASLDDVFKDKTVIVVAHRLSTIRKADQIVVMQSGMVVEIGNHQTLMERKGRYFQLVQSQLDLSPAVIPEKTEAVNS